MLEAERSARLAWIRARPESLEPGLRLILDDAAGLEGRIDLVGRDRRGGAVVIGVASGGLDDLTALAHLLAQRSWLTPRVRDWARLAPQLGLAPERGVRAILCADQFDPRTVALADSLGDAVVSLQLLAPLPAEPRAEPTPAAAPAVAAAPPAPPVPGGPALRSRFRTGLRSDPGRASPADDSRPRSAPRGTG